jgi:peptidyl-prolyl cis-trans isomerase B (cyclophilin B)
MTMKVLNMLRVLAVLTFAFGAAGSAQTKPAQKKPVPKKPAATTPAPKPVTPTAAPGTGPILVIETAKGTIEIETYAEDAPKTVAHVAALVKRGFYNGLRFHRVIPDFMIQGGDPYSRDTTKRELWGTGGSGKPVGVAEFSKRRLHRVGTFAMAHAGDPRLADSQFYIVTGSASHLDGRHVVIGQVIGGLDVPTKIQAGDIMKKVSLKAAAAGGASRP